MNNKRFYWYRIQSVTGDLPVEPYTVLHYRNCIEITK